MLAIQVYSAQVTIGLPMATYDNDILEAALIGYEHQRKEIETKIEQIRAHLGGHVTPNGKTAPGRKRTFSAATRKRMAAAQQKRWASKNAGGAEAVTPAEVAPAKATKKAGGKRTPMSAEARERIAAAQRKRWAKTNKAAKKKQ
jgi:hypothetical protein